MGLWKKKTPVTPRSDSVAEVDFQWSTQSYTLKEIISTFKLPCVVQCSADSCSVLWSKFQFDLKQPLLLNSVRSVSKIYARTVRTDKTTGQYVEFGPPLVIPEDYQGWFGFTEENSNALPRYTRVEQVAESEGDYFLATTRVPAFIKADGESSGVYSQQFLIPGHVLRKDGFVNGPLDAPSHSHFAAKDKHHLRCVDTKEEEYILPFSHRGLFYDVSNDITKLSSGVFSTNQLMATGGSHFPLTVRHVQGDLPALNYSFTGILKCTHIFSEQTILACSVDEYSPTPLELACKSKIRFSIALNDIDFKARNGYSRASDFCSHSSEKYAQAIKVAFTLKPEMSTLEELDFALYDTGSDVEDVDAQSEFDFDWDPDDNESKEALEILVQSKKKESSDLSNMNFQEENSVDIGIPYNLEHDPETLIIKRAVEYTVSRESQDSVLEQDVTVGSSHFGDSDDNRDVGVPYKLEHNTDTLIIKKAVEYTVSTESQDSVLGQDVTVDSSLFEDSKDSRDITLDNIPVKQDMSFPCSSDDNKESTGNYATDNNGPSDQPPKQFEFIGNLSKAVPGRLLKDEVTRTSSGLDATDSTKNITVDWGPEIPPIKTPFVGQYSPIRNQNLNQSVIDEIENDKNENRIPVDTIVHSSVESVHSDTSGRCIVDRDKDTTGRLTSYRSLGSLNKLDHHNFEQNAILDQIVFPEDDGISLSDDESFRTETSISESEFILPNGYINDNSSEINVQMLSLPSPSKFVEPQTMVGSSSRVGAAVVEIKPKLKGKFLELERNVMDMSLEEAAV